MWFKAAEVAEVVVGKRDWSDDRDGEGWRLTSPDTVGIYLINLCGFTPYEPSMPSFGLGGYPPKPKLGMEGSLGVKPQGLMR